MIVTQDQAVREQQCYRVQDQGCRASACMGWRWYEKMPKARSIACENPAALTADDGRAGVTAIPDGYKFECASLTSNVDADGKPMVAKAARWVEPDGSCAHRRTGYCGPAGVASIA